MSESFRNPQLVPAESCMTILADYGPDGGGWGPVAVELPGMRGPRPFVYTGRDPNVVPVMTDVCRALSEKTGMAVRLCRFTVREDIAEFGPSPEVPTMQDEQEVDG